MNEYEENYYRMAFRKWIKKVDFVLEMGIEKDEILL